MSVVVKSVRWTMLALSALQLATAQASGGTAVFTSDFELAEQPFHLLSGCQISREVARNGQSGLLCQRGNSTLISRQQVAEIGLLELWVKPLSNHTSYRINILTSPSVQADSQWTQVFLI